MDWKRIFDQVGLNGTWWQWRIIKLQDRLQSFFASFREPAQRVTYEHKTCPACGALVDRNEATCMRCGARVGSWRAQTIKRFFALALPQWCPVSLLLLFANVANLLAVMMFFGGQNLLQPQGIVLLRMGALDPMLFLDGDYYRIITYGFLHIGILHIAFNLLALSQVGPALEQHLGKARFFSLYMLSLLGGGAADVLVRGDVRMLIGGASGALFGLIGFGVAYAHVYGGGRGSVQRNFFLQWAVYGFLFGFVVGADNICHAGGFITGGVLGFLMAKEIRIAHSLDRFWSALALLLLALTLAAFAWLIKANL
jgi:rhomboid protease GluP